MIFAAGFGTRMRHLTKHQPKPMIPVAGRPLIDHALDLAREITPPVIVANSHYKSDVLADHLAGSEVVISHEDPQILDTGGGLRHALPLLGTHSGPVYTVNPDVVWRGPNPLRLLRDAWDPACMDALLTCIPMSRTVGCSGDGDFHKDEEGRLHRGGNLVYGGVQLLRTNRLAEIDETVFSLNTLWDLMAAKGRLFALEYPGHWCDVGTPEGIPLAEDLIAQDEI
ncbi:nucleotidyltransferase family protein [Phaeobacter inhibens]|uniref:nucleotidyltransferase family protein n=1 Tax=Phaeobacter inhibens TaxID=221822 RepID=UPI0021A3109F|nr:nucleotidyltransferase family protein [Phaeobacter inhibens]UWR78244.1 nucleotidyltransferase family protein [Phaeobacter inhibens]